MRKISRSNGKEYLDLAYEYVQELAEIENEKIVLEPLSFYL